ncbi:hypothetical protein PybrP1_012110, partial [[Pythium] brassicae (nom. inval.)]
MRLPTLLLLATLVLGTASPHFSASHVHAAVPSSSHSPNADPNAVPNSSSSSSDADSSATSSPSDVNSGPNADVPSTVPSASLCTTPLRTGTLSLASCAFECFTMDTGTPQAYGHFTFLVPFGGGWTSAQELQPGANVTEVAADRNVELYASESNALLQRIDALVLPPATSSVQIVGGSTSKPTSLKGRVANVELSPQLVANQSQLGAVLLENLRLELITNTLSAMLPPQLRMIRVDNGLLSRFPLGLDKFKSLAVLSLARNYIATVNASMGLPAVTLLDLTRNQLTSFEAHFPNLTILHLGGNNLTAIPPVVYKHQQLQTLVITSNKMANVTLTKAQAKFLANLTEFAFDATSLARGCASAAQVVVHNATFCVSEASGDDDETSDGKEDGKGPSSVVLVLVVCVTLLLLGGIVFVYRAQTASLRGRAELDDESSEADGVTTSGASTASTSESKRGRSTPSRHSKSSRHSSSTVADNLVQSLRSARLRNPFRGKSASSASASASSAVVSMVASKRMKQLVEMALLQLVSTGELRLRPSATCPPAIAGLVDRCLALDPADRPPAPALAYEFRLMRQRMGAYGE